MKQSKLPISFADYQRLYRVIYTVLQGAGAITAHSCKYFAIAGAYILESTHRLNARPRFGSAFYLLDDAPDLFMAYTDMDAFHRHEIDSHAKAFHAWIECEGTVIDLLAPLFRENFLSQNPDSSIRLPRNMFQRPMALMAQSPFDLKEKGDFYLAVNPALTNEMILDFANRNMNSDLVDICRQWYKPTPKKIVQELVMSSNDGTHTQMKLDMTELVGKW